MEEERRREEEGEKIKRGRKMKKNEEEGLKNKEQSKFFVDLGKDKQAREKVIKILQTVNNKNYGGEITFKDVAVFAIGRLADKDLEKLKEQSLSKMEKVQRLLDEHNKKNNSNEELGEFLAKKLGIN